MKFGNIGKNIVLLLILLVLIIPSLIPLFNQGFMVTDDGGWMIIRLSAFYDTLRDGQIPARFIERLNFGYGYPVANFLYPGYLYLGSAVHILGFNFIDSVKVLFGLSLAFSGLFSFIWLRRLFGGLDSLLGALVYVYLPYHLFDVFRRGSLGEALSISILPLAFFGIEKASTILIAISVFSIMILHNTLAVFFIPLIPIYALIRKSFVRSIPGMILGLMMSAFFTIPAILELKNTKFLETLISNPSEYFADVYLVGIISLVAFISVVILSLVIYKNELSKIPYRNLLISFLILFIFSIILSTSISSFIWERINFSLVQFPYRFLSLGIVSVSFLVAFMSYILFAKAKVILFVVVVFLLGFFSFRFISEVEYTQFPDEYYSTNDSTTTVHDEYMPIWVKNKPLSRPNNKIEIISGDVVISNIIELSNKIKFDIVVGGPSRVRVNTIYWPGWKVFVDGDEKVIDYDNEFGVIEFDLEQYDNRVYISFQDDLIRILSNTLTVIAALLLIYYISRPLIKL